MDSHTLFYLQAVEGKNTLPRKLQEEDDQLLLQQQVLSSSSASGSSEHKDSSCSNSTNLSEVRTFQLCHFSLE